MAFLALEVPWVKGLLFWVSLLLCWDSSCAGCGCNLSVTFTEFPSAVSNENATVFSFEPVVDGKVEACSDWNFSCKLDSGAPSDCPCKISYGGLLDGNHSFEVCANGSQGSGCVSYNWTIDRMKESCDLMTSIPEETIQFNNQDRTLEVTSNQDNLRFYLNFSGPVMNSSAEILESLNTSQGTLLPINEETLGNQRFGFMVANISGFAIITISLKSESIITGQGTAVSPPAPITFVYDSQRPTANVSTTSTSRTRETEIPISIKFGEPVFGFNSSNIAISGGHLWSFHEMSKSRYFIMIKADDGIVSVSIPENATGDIAGNKNLPSIVLQVRHYSKPIISSVASVTSNAALFTASLATGLLSVSTASLHATGAFAMTSATPISYPSTYLFRMVSHVQVFALSRWLAVELPVEYYELARDMQWSIPYFSLPWEVRHVQPPASSTSHFSDVLDLEIVGTPKEEKLIRAAKGPKPLSVWDIISFLELVNSTSEAADPQHNNGWTNFGRNMFWLVIIDGSLIFLHALLLLILTCKKKTTEKQDGYMTLLIPRLEMLLLIQALPCVSQASSALIRGGTPSGMVVGILLLGLVAFELLSLFLFLSVGIASGKLLRYEEVHQGGRRELIRDILGPGEKGQGTWKQNSDSVWPTIFGPLFEDLRGPPENMLSRICGANPREGDRGTASDGGTKDAKVPLIRKMLGILRIYYPLLECIKRVTLGIFAGTDWTGRYSRTPTIALLCITSFQLLFLVLKKPFRNKKVQLVEIISVSAELGIFASSAVISSKKLSRKDESGVGIFMVVLFLIALAAQMVNTWDALYSQIKRLDPDSNLFRRGLKVAFLGLLVLLIPQKTEMDHKARPSGGETADPGSSARSGLQEISSPTED